MVLSLSGTVLFGSVLSCGDSGQALLFLLILSVLLGTPLFPFDGFESSFKRMVLLGLISRSSLVGLDLVSFPFPNTSVPDFSSVLIFLLVISVSVPPDPSLPFVSSKGLVNLSLLLVLPLDSEYPSFP